jgi:hypothetical protein
MISNSLNASRDYAKLAALITSSQPPKMFERGHWQASIFCFLVVSSRPISVGHDWPLYGDEYGRIKFGNVLVSASQICYKLIESDHKKHCAKFYDRLSGTLKQNRQHEKYHLWYKRTVLPLPLRYCEPFLVIRKKQQQKRSCLSCKICMLSRPR